VLCSGGNCLILEPSRVLDRRAERKGGVQSGAEKGENGEEGKKEGRKEGRKEGGKEGKGKRRCGGEKERIGKIKTHINAVFVASGSRSTTNDPRLL